MSYYGVSGDVRGDLNGWAESSSRNYKGESQIPGLLIERGRKFATDVINAKLRPMYGTSIPFASGSVPSLVDEIANCLAKGWVIGQLSPGPEPKKNNKFMSETEHCREALDSLSTGEMELPEVQPIADSDEVYHTNSGYTPAFDIDPVEDSQFDPDREDAIDRG